MPDAARAGIRFPRGANKGDRHRGIVRVVGLFDLVWKKDEGSGARASGRDAALGMMTMRQIGYGIRARPDVCSVVMYLLRPEHSAFRFFRCGDR